MSGPIDFYVSATCPYCMMAKRLLDDKGLSYNVIMVDNDMAKRREMEERAGRTSVPQIFFGERHIGGFDDLSELDIDGELDKLIESGWS
ncbi:glutaredoxin 3 [Granulosicoccaceae sp. 1_MG-2023]|nr:glutaredoxin 3 [Granulosicoccaceae sp. 1_MG-2023]